MEKIAALLLVRKYEKLGKKLPDKFWNLPEYKKEYQMQCRLAAKFLRSFSQEIILSVLEQEKWCFSLAAKALTLKFELEASKRKLAEDIKTVKKKPEEEVINHNIPTFRPQVRKTFKEDE